MLTKETIVSFLKMNKLIFKEKYNIIKIGLFGSYARNEYTETSDVDILIELDSNTKDIFEKKQELRKYLEENLHKKIDICREKYIRSYVRKEILKEVVYV
jgi:predicted nucleotidyltransferase